MQIQMHSVDLQHRSYHPLLYVVVFTCIIPFGGVSASDSQNLHSRQSSTRCTDPGAGMNSSCWDILDIPAWLSQFAGPNSTCATSSLSTIAGSTSSWGTCFVLDVNDGDEGQTIANGLGSLDADTTANTLDQYALSAVPVGDRARHIYVLEALSRLSEFFVDWSQDVSSYVIASEFDVPTILDTLDPDRLSSFPADDLYRALLLGLPFSIAYNGTFLPPFSVMGIPPELSLVDMGGLLRELVGLAEVPLSNLSATAGNASTVRASDLPLGLTQFADALRSRLQEGLQSMTTDLDTFRNATADGTFATAEHWSIPQGPGILLQPLDTYLVSSILAQSNWAIVALVGVDVAALTQNSTGTLPAWALSNCPTCTPPVDFGCQGYDSNNQCGRWWYSQDLNSSFTLVQERNLSNDPTELITTVFQQGWTTGNLLFENAAICDEPTNLVGLLESLEVAGRPASPLTDYMDSWFWRLMGVVSRAGTASVDVIVSDPFNRYIASKPGPVNHPAGTLYNITNDRIDFSCISQLDLQLAWNWTGIRAGIFV